MINQKVKYTLLIIMTFFAIDSMAITASQRVHTELQKVDVSSATVTINDKLYKYSPNKKISSYRQSKIEPQSIRSLVIDRKYYFEILQGLNGKQTDSNKQNTIIFITEEKLPE